jgi:thiamine pyrophosphokinase
MNVGISIAGIVDFDLHDFTNKNKIDKWIAVDGGYDHLLKQNIKCSTLIGDLDSIISSIDSKVDVIKLNPVKAETDFEMACAYVNEKFGDVHIYVVGIIGNDRFEHFYANLKMLSSNIELHTKNTIFKLIENQQSYTIKYQPNHQFVSFFAKDDISEFSITDAKYILNKYHLTTNDIRCISNEFINKDITVNINEGSLIIVLSGEYYTEMAI